MMKASKKINDETIFNALTLLWSLIMIIKSRFYRDLCYFKFNQIKYPYLSHCFVVYASFSFAFSTGASIIAYTQKRNAMIFLAICCAFPRFIYLLLEKEMNVSRKGKSKSLSILGGKWKSLTSFNGNMVIFPHPIEIPLSAEQKCKSLSRVYYPSFVSPQKMISISNDRATSS